MIQVKVKPNAKKSALVRQADGTWIAHVPAPPVDGKANEALLRLIAEHFQIRKNAVTIQSGQTARIKRVRIAVNSNG